MSEARRFEDLGEVSIEHGLSASSSKGFVKMRATGRSVVLLCQMTPAEAREQAMHLLEAAARAEYEQDFWAGSMALGASEQAAGAILAAVRQGEARRHRDGGTDG